MGRAPDAPSADDALAANRAWWDAAVPVHLGSDFYDVEGWLEEGRGPKPREAALLGDVTGLELVHLQCHFGKDTLSWARAGAGVTGLDFSPTAVDAARSLAARAGLADRADFVCAPVADAVDALGGRTFDIVYVSLGALCWLPRIDQWAAQVGALLRPGGRLFLHEVHPMSTALADDDLTVVYPYFEESAPYADSQAGTYADTTAIVGQTYTYYVTAYAGACSPTQSPTVICGTSPPSAMVSTTVPPASSVVTSLVVTIP